jgi:putative transposase
MGASHIEARSDGVEYRLGRPLPDCMAERLEAVAAGGLALFASHMQEGLLAASVAVGLESMRQLMEAEVTQVVGPKGRHQRNARTAYRHGHEAGTVVLGARKIPVQHPRVRTRSGQEVVLSVYRTLAEMDLLTEQTVARMLAGLSVREYQVGLEPVGAEVEDTASSTSRSAVSCRFVAATKARLDAFRSRDLSGERFLVVFADGFDFVGQTMVGALGVTAAGIKVPLGVVQGSTENAEVVRGLMSDLRDRGLNPL